VTAAAQGSARSAALYERAVKVIPGGVNSPVRAMRQIGRDPIFVDRGEGAELIDVDGNRYVDWVCSWGPLILGHAEPSVVAAVIEAAKRGTSYGAATAVEVALAETIVDRVPSAEMVRMTSSGTEAAMSAVRLARAVTGRDVVVKFAGAYHGHSDGLLAEGGSGLATLSVPGSPGVPAAMAELTVVVPWNDREAVTKALADYEVAALLVEPIAANMGVVPADDGFLEFLREQTSASGTLLVFDEVITGFRVARGGAQELYGIDPDLTVMGKVHGGGLPAAAFGGPAEIMDMLAPAGPVYQAGTLSGNPLATAAGLATLRACTPEVYTRVDAAAATVAKLTADALSRSGVPHRLQAGGNLFSVFLGHDQPVRDFDEARWQSRDAYAAFFHAMLAAGVYLPPSGYEAWFLSAAHDDTALSRIADALPGAAQAAAAALG
jgi:glutamate-1-semialdehyde 2,1-aminomutase